MSGVLFNPFSCFKVLVPYMRGDRLTLGLSVCAFFCQKMCPKDNFLTKYWIKNVFHVFRGRSILTELPFPLFQIILIRKSNRLPEHTIFVYQKKRRNEIEKLPSWKETTNCNEFLCTPGPLWTYLNFWLIWTFVYL